MRDATRGLPHNQVFLFEVENWLHGKSETSNISGTVPPIFFILSPCVLENNGLLNKNYWNELDIIDQGKGNVSQFCLYLGYHWTNLNKIRTTMMQKNVLPSDSENVEHGHHLHFRYYTTDFYKTFI